jgi:hypothetical protein
MAGINFHNSKYLVQIQIIQNQFKMSEGGKWNSHQIPCVYSSRLIKNYRICPIRIKDMDVNMKNIFIVYFPT